MSLTPLSNGHKKALNRESPTMRDIGFGNLLGNIVDNVISTQADYALQASTIKGCTDKTTLSADENTITTEFTDTATNTVVRRDVTTIVGDVVTTVKTWIPTGYSETTVTDINTLEGGTT